MGRYSLIKNGVVVNIITASKEFIASYAEENDFNYVDYELYSTAHIGTTTSDGIVFLDPNQPELQDNMESPMIEPTVIGATPI